MFVLGRKDGGPESKVKMYGIEFKRLFSVVLLKFEEGSREAFHSHAFNSKSYVIKGELDETFPDGKGHPIFAGEWITTTRETVHKVYGRTRATWVLSFRGPWVKNWYELLGEGGQERVDLTHGREVDKTVHPAKDRIL